MCASSFFRFRICRCSRVLLDFCTNNQDFSPDLAAQITLLDRPRWVEVLHSESLGHAPELREHFAAQCECANWFMTRRATQAPDPLILSTFIARARCVSAACLARLEPTEAQRRGIDAYMPFPRGQTKSFGGVHLEAINQALDWLRTGRSSADGIVVTSHAGCVCSIACMLGHAWVFDLRPCPAIRGAISNSTLWAAFRHPQDAVDHLRWRYPDGGPWSGWSGSTVVAWSAEPART